MRATRTPLIIGLIATLAVLGWLLLIGGGGGSGPPAGEAPGVLSPADRDALGAEPVDPGPRPDVADPSVELTDPAAVAAAYVSAGYSLRDTDAGHTNRRASPYAAPASPPATVGVLVVAAPPPGHRTVATVTDVTQIGFEPTDARRGYLVGYRTALDPPDAGDDPARHTRYLLLVRQFDGHWLVAVDAADAQVGEP